MSVTRVMTIERVLSHSARATYGRCPVCERPHGEACNPDVGFPIGQSAGGGPPVGGAHLARLWNAPRRIREVPVA